jgi:integrase
VDPDTGKHVTEALSDADGRTTETRAAFATRVWRRLQKRRQEIKDGAQPLRSVDHALVDLVAAYFAAHTQLRPRTTDGYREATDIFLGWCEQRDITTPRMLSRGKLVEFRTSRINALHKVREGESRSAYTINKELTRVGIVLGWLVDAEKVRLTRDDVRIGLKKIDVETSTAREFLSREQLAALLAAAVRHDAICYRATRSEHKNGAGDGTPRYIPIEPWLRFLLLTGCRRSEALAITWANVDLANRRITIYASQAKTKFDRVIDLDVCPSLIDMLRTMSEGCLPHERVWHPHTAGSVDAALDRLRADGLCPPFSYQLCRVTCATYLANMASFGPVNESRQLGHSLIVADKFYLGRARIAASVTTLEDAYGLTLQAVPPTPNA